MHWNRNEWRHRTATRVAAWKKVMNRSEERDWERTREEIQEDKTEKSRRVESGEENAMERMPS